MLNRMLRSALFWGVSMGVAGALVMALMRFDLREIVDYLSFAPLAALLGAVYQLVVEGLSRRRPAWPRLAQKLLAGFIVGLGLSVLAAAIFMYLNIKTGGIKGAGPSRDFLVYLLPMLLLLPPCLLLAAITPDRR
jgi:hypothetical protein